MTRIGIAQVLARDGIEIVGAEPRPASLAEAVERLRPDAVLLDRDARARDAAERVRAARPSTAIVLLDRDERLFDLLPAGAAQWRTVRPLVPDLLPAALAESLIPLPSED